ncbi:MAG: hypothetical protein IPO90_13165 [Flavobacteriales bacterium]|nr:hypothetical protein [Flavobacteriales bacterium]
MKLYRYCASREHMLTWIDGGPLPLKLASFHRHNERQGTQTPDEVVQRQLHGMTKEQFERLFRMDPKRGGSIRVTELTINQRPQPNVTWVRISAMALFLPVYRTQPSARDAFRQTLLCRDPDEEVLRSELSSHLGLKAVQGAANTPQAMTEALS